LLDTDIFPPINSGGSNATNLGPALQGCRRRNIDEQTQEIILLLVGKRRLLNNTMVNVFRVVPERTDSPLIYLPKDASAYVRRDQLDPQLGKTGKS
jgi:hypothetical protein